MPYDPDVHRRRSIRLKGYDYSQAGAYFVTICAEGRSAPFGSVVDGEMVPNAAGRMAQTIWEELPGRFPTMHCDCCVVMPNHLHAVVVLVGAPLVGAPHLHGNAPASVSPRAGTRPAPTGPRLGDTIAAFKSLTTNEYARRVRSSGWPPFQGRLWQHNYYEHIIRTEAALDTIREYIAINPLRWHLDHENPDRLAEDEFDRGFQTS